MTSSESTRDQQPKMTNEKFRLTDTKFIASCDEAGLEPTKRQASKYRRRMGKAWMLRGANKAILNSKIVEAQLAYNEAMRDEKLAAVEMLRETDEEKLEALETIRKEHEQNAVNLSSLIASLKRRLIALG